MSSAEGPAVPSAEPDRTSPWRHLAVPLLVLLSLPLIFWKLGSYGVVNGDEALYHDVARTMLETGNWLRVEFAGQHRVYDTFMNAPLQYWIKAPLIALLGDNYWSMRLLSAVCGLFCVLATRRLAMRVAPPEVSHLAGFLAGFVQLTTFQFLYLHSARTGELDALLALVFVGIAWTFLRAVQDGKSFVPHHAILALLFVIKLPIILVPVGAELLFLVAHAQGRAQLGKWVRTALWVFPLGLLWHLGQALALWEEFLGVMGEMRGQAAGGAKLGLFERIGRNAGFYGETAVFGVWPWIFVHPVALVAGLLRARDEERRGLLALLAFAASVVAFFLLVDKHHRWYTAPSYPFLACFSGLWLARLLTRAPKVLDLALVATILAATAFVELVFAELNPFAHTAKRAPVGFEWRVVGELPTALGVLGSAVLLFAALFVLARAWRGRAFLASGGALLALLGAAALWRVALPLRYTDYVSPMEVQAREVHAKLERGAELALPVRVRDPADFKVKYFYYEHFVIRPAQREQKMRGVHFLLTPRPSRPNRDNSGD